MNFALAVIIRSHDTASAADRPAGGVSFVLRSRSYRVSRVCVRARIAKSSKANNFERDASLRRTMTVRKFVFFSVSFAAPIPQNTVGENLHGDPPRDFFQCRY